MVKRRISLLGACVLLISTHIAVSPVSGSSPNDLSRGDFVQAMYDTYVEHSGITVRQEQARTRPGSSDVKSSDLDPRSPYDGLPYGR